METLTLDHPQGAARPALRLVRRLALAAVGGLFLLAGLLKAGIFPTFAESTATFLGLPAGPAAAAAVAVLLVEIVAGAALAANRWVRPAALALSGLLVLFVAVLARAAWTGLEAECHCFGTTGVNLPYGAQIALDAVLLAVLGLLLRTEPRRGAR